MLVNSGEESALRQRSVADTSAGFSPVYFKRQVQDVVSATLNFGSALNIPKPKGVAAKMGLRFEKEVLAQLHKTYSFNLATGVPLSFQEGSSKNGFYQRPSTAIPDGLLLSQDKKSLLIIECKLRHSTDAWFQLNRFYLPILRRAVGDSLILRTLEICRYYDPGVRLPEVKKLVLGVEEAFSIKDGNHPVLIWEK